MKAGAKGYLVKGKFFVSRVWVEPVLCTGSRTCAWPCSSVCCPHGSWRTVRLVMFLQITKRNVVTLCFSFFG
jgi:hypothetical protein